LKKNSLITTLSETRNPSKDPPKDVHNNNIYIYSIIIIIIIDHDFEDLLGHV
jgi:hypothetical protein